MKFSSESSNIIVRQNLGSKPKALFLALSFIFVWFPVKVLASDCEGNCWDGYGVQTEAYGEWTYEGFFVRGDRHGKGKLTWADGAAYEGDFNKNNRHGRGKYTWPNGDVYEGDFVKNAHAGKGKFTWASGDAYEGDYVEDERTGQGKYTWPSGNVYEGDFVKGLKEGKGIFKHESSNTTYEGNFVDNLMHGPMKVSSSSYGTEMTRYYLSGNVISESEWNKHLRSEERKAREEAEAIEEQNRLYEQRQRIYNACYIDKSKGADMSSFSVKRAVERLCDDIKENPSWFDRLKYD